MPAETSSGGTHCTQMGRNFNFSLMLIQTICGLILITMGTCPVFLWHRHPRLPSRHPRIHISTIGKHPKVDQSEAFSTFSWPVIRRTCRTSFPPSLLPAHSWAEWDPNPIKPNVQSSTSFSPLNASLHTLWPFSERPVPCASTSPNTFRMGVIYMRM